MLNTVQERGQVLRFPHIFRFLNQRFSNDLTGQVLQKCLPDSLVRMHALRERALLQAMETLVHGRRLTLIDVACAWPDAERVRPPLKAFDRLLSNRHMQAEREPIHQDMARWLLRGSQPVIVIDWTDLKADKLWCLLRAAVPVGGRTLTLLDMVFPGKEQGSPRKWGQVEFLN